MSTHVLHAPSFTLPVRRTHRTAVRNPRPASRQAGTPVRPASVRPAASAPRAARVGSPRRSPLHLTRRGRLVFVGLPVLLATALLLTVVGVFTTAPAAAEQGVRAVPSTPAVQVTVRPGESLWELAAANAHGRDTRDVVAQIVELNGLRGDAIESGRKLYVPLGS
ncbi:hypothetical protein GCM10011512_23120 [Tersicoccus solisilvae]|uniref:LysM domain-containing protein n=1 Tax=Tersicoccus solisilvae TaxID=1882339 RepID=A0ABQ1PE59_9MICC|nr:LysM peptidoglycan-binding domain-containing protein [Tersicoccus solisilvae]GGC95461.1 hypothetical protein GCM10011512_23120 [Tersicoccus solisilvae]